jgi:protocatechuate 3,4-dioxygenase beta subunit
MKFNNKRNIVGYFAFHFASSFALLALLAVLLIVGLTSPVNASLLGLFGYNNESEEGYNLENSNEKQQMEYASGNSKSTSNISEQEVEDGEIASIIEQNRRLLMIPEAERQILSPATLKTNDIISKDLNYIEKTSNNNPDADINNVEASSSEKQSLQNANLDIGVEDKQGIVEATVEATAENLKEEKSGKVILKDVKETQNTNTKIPNVNSKKLPPKTFILKNVNKQKSALEQAKMVKIAEEGKELQKDNTDKAVQNIVTKKVATKTATTEQAKMVKIAEEGKELQKDNTDKAVQNIVTKKVATKTATTEEDPLLTSADANLARAESKNSLDNSKNKVKAKFFRYVVKKPSLAPSKITEKSEKPILSELEPENVSNRQKYSQDIIRDIKNRGKSRGESQEKNKAPLYGAYVDKSSLTYEQDNSLLNANRQDLQKNAELDYSSLNRKIDQFKPRTPTPNRLFNADISKPDRFNNSNNLVKKTGSFYRAFGEIVLLQGQVTDSFGVPVVNATIEIWQANSAGKYHNLLEPDSEYIDRYFNMSGRAVTDNLGYYNFITIIPGSVANRAPHINMNLRHKNFGTLETEMYFFQHPENKKDSYYLSYSPQERAMLTAMVEYSQLNNPKSLKVATFNIVIRGSHQYKKY